MTPEEYPALGTRIMLTRYASGSANTGDLADPEFAAAGVVVASPRHGGRYLTVHTDVDTGRRDYDPADPDAWYVSGDIVSVSLGAMWQWTISRPAEEYARVVALVNLRGVPAAVVSAEVRAGLALTGAELVASSWDPDQTTIEAGKKVTTILIDP